MKILFPEKNDDDVSWVDSHLIPAVATVKHFIAIMNQVVLCVQNNDLDDFEQEEYISAKGTNWGQFQRTSTQPQSAQPQSAQPQSAQAQAQSRIDNPQSRSNKTGYEATISRGQVGRGRGSTGSSITVDLF